MIHSMTTLRRGETRTQQGWGILKDIVHIGANFSLKITEYTGR